MENKLKKIVMIGPVYPYKGGGVTLYRDDVSGAF